MIRLDNTAIIFEVEYNGDILTYETEDAEIEFLPGAEEMPPQPADSWTFRFRPRKRLEVAIRTGIVGRIKATLPKYNRILEGDGSIRGLGVKSSPAGLRIDYIVVKLTEDV